MITNPTTKPIHSCAQCGQRSGRNMTDSAYCAQCGEITETKHERLYLDTEGGASKPRED